MNPLFWRCLQYTGWQLVESSTPEGASEVGCAATLRPRRLATILVSG